MKTLHPTRPSCNYDVMTRAAKDTFVQIRIRDDVKKDLQTVAELRGLSMSALIHSLIVKAVREERTNEPTAFAQNSLTPATTIRIRTEDNLRETG